MLLYHHSSKKNRPSIERRGLLRSFSEASEMGGSGGIFFTTRATPTKYIDCWEVDTDKFPLRIEEDFTTEPFEGETWWVAWYDDIPPSALTRAHSGAERRGTR